MSSQTLPAIYTLEEIEAVASASDASFLLALVDRIAQGFIDYEDGKFCACPIQTLGLPPYEFVCDAASSTSTTYSAQTCVKSGYFKGGETYVIKVASGGSPLPANSGLLQVYSQRTGRLEGLLLDEGVLTEIRTAAVGALVAKHRVGDLPSVKVGVVGTGTQARYQLQALKTVLPNCTDVRIYGQDSVKARQLRSELSADWDATVVEAPSELLQSCQLIVTTTSAREALLTMDDFRCRSSDDGMLHITCIGADAPGKQELDPRLVAEAGLLIADSVSQTKERGEFQHALLQGMIDESSIVPLGRYLKDPSSVPAGTKLSVFDSSGVALQDCVIAEVVMSLLVEKSS